MSIDQIAMVLEISGFIIAGVFAGIFLEKEAVGHFADKLYSTLKLIDKTLQKIPWSFFFPCPTVKEKIINFSFGPIVTITGIVVAIIGWIKNLSWMAWLGIAIVIALVVYFTASYLTQKKRGFCGQQCITGEICLAIFAWANRRWQIPLLAVQILIIDLLNAISFIFIAPILVSLIVLRFLMSWLVGRDLLKKAMIVFGSTLLLSGLILEFIATL